MKKYKLENQNVTFPLHFKQEIMEYLGYYDHDSEADEEYIDKEFKKAENEDPP